MANQTLAGGSLSQELATCINFLESVGITCRVAAVNHNTGFLPGLSINCGVLEIDLPNLKHPGDILHEAGHIAVVPSSERPFLNASDIEKRDMREAEEMMAICWSYAACVHLQLDPHFVFHEEGYHGGGGYIADNFIQGRYLGLPMLQWIGLTNDEKNAALRGVSAYPVMEKWLRD